MAQQRQRLVVATALQTCNNELVKCVEQLAHERNELERRIRLEETEKQQLEEQIYTLGEKLSRLNQTLAIKVAVRNEYDRTLCETEKAYAKIVESSQTLVNVLKRESSMLNKKT